MTAIFDRSPPTTKVIGEYEFGPSLTAEYGLDDTVNGQFLLLKGPDTASANQQWSFNISVPDWYVGVDEIETVVAIDAGDTQETIMDKVASAINAQIANAEGITGSSGCGVLDTDAFPPTANPDAVAAPWSKYAIAFWLCTSLACGGATATPIAALTATEIPQEDYTATANRGVSTGTDGRIAKALLPASHESQDIGIVSGIVAVNLNRGRYVSVEQRGVITSWYVSDHCGSDTSWFQLRIKSSGDAIAFGFVDAWFATKPASTLSVGEHTLAFTRIGDEWFGQYLGADVS